ncbi:MAG: glycerophosphoryl diester phosphodiesterase [Rhodospirillales bacterium]|jgi:glycerophosphoryl diester phosphodiesterase
MKSPTPFVIGHRGAAGHAPENTLVSFHKAASIGARWVEFDVRLTRDGVPILFHDETLERTTNGRGKISALDWESIHPLDAGRWYSNEFTNERIPTLDEALVTLKNLNLGANVEIKSTPGREIESGHGVAAVLKKHWSNVSPPPLISSFKRDCIVAAKEEAPEFHRAFIVGKIPPNWKEILKELACEGLHCRHDQLNAKTAQEILSSGYALRCYTVNSNKRATKLRVWGVHSVFTDYPDQIDQIQ